MKLRVNEANAQNLEGPCRDGRVVRRFRPKILPEDPAVIEAIEALL